MEQVLFSPWFVWFVPAWLVFVILLSVLVRKRRGRPIIPEVPANALYAERNASGGMASNCLIVAVTPDALVVTPRFPFNLMFLPEIYGMEYVVPHSAISQVTGPDKSLLGNVTIALRDGRRLRLKVNDPAALIDAVNRPRR